MKSSSTRSPRPSRSSNPVSSYRGVPYTLQAGVYRLHLPTGTESFGHSKGGKGAMLARVDALLDSSKRVANPRAKVYKRTDRSTKRKTFQVQEFRFDKHTWSPGRVETWLKRNNHRVGHVKSGDAYFHVTQHSPSDYQAGTLHVVHVAKHVEAVVGIPKSHSDAAGARGYGSRGPRQGQLFTRSAPGMPAHAVDPDDIIW